MKKVIVVLLALCALTNITACSSADITNSNVLESETNYESIDFGEEKFDEENIDDITSDNSVTKNEIIDNGDISVPQFSETESIESSSSNISSDEVVSSESSSTPSFNISMIAVDVPSEDEVEWHKGYISSQQDYFKPMTYSELNLYDVYIHYLFHCPSRETNEPQPLVIFLHGQGDYININNLGTATQFVESLIALENENEKYNAYTLVPMTPTLKSGDYSNGWWSSTEIYYFKKLINILIEKYNIDPNRVYITGISMGGFITCKLVDEMPPNTFAAAVPLSGAQNMSYPNDKHNTAFRIYHSTYDNVVNVSCARELFQQLISSGHPNVELVEFEDGNHISPLYSVYTEQRRSFFDWLFEQRLP